MTATNDAITIPAALADVALIDGKTVSASAGISISQFHELVRRGDAPQPAMRGHRCTRWRISDVRAWLIRRVEDAATDTSAAEAITARNIRASAAARAKRATFAQAAG